MDNISQKFINGLREKYNMEFDEIKNYIYCGGNYDQHYNYYKACFDNAPLPDAENKCICNNKIINNCYIRKDINTEVDDIIIVGSCCISKFLPNGFNRYCGQCGEVHQRRKYNICFDCDKKNNELSPYMYFDFSYDMKDQIKKDGANWDDEYKLWRVKKQYKPKFIEKYDRYIIDDIISFCKNRDQKRLKRIEEEKLPKEYKYFKYGENETAKSEGYRWDNNIKKWWRPIQE